MRQVTIFAFVNYRYFTDNPYGLYQWYSTRRARDQAVTSIETKAAAGGLSDPHFGRVTKRIRTEAQHAWLDELRARRVLRPLNDASHMWTDEAETDLQGCCHV